VDPSACSHPPTFFLPQTSNISLRHPASAPLLQKQFSFSTQPRLATNIQNGSHQGGELLPLL
jgi:hypothetical protein